MTQHLDAKQYLPVTVAEREALCREASARGLSTGLLARVLFMYGLANIDGPELVQLVHDEKSATKQRISAGARVAVKARWAHNHQGEK